MDVLTKVMDGHTIQVLFFDRGDDNTVFISQCVECEKHNSFIAHQSMAVETMVLIDQENQFHASGYEVDWHDSLAFGVDED